MGAHGLASGVTSALSGENFGRGFLSGAASSGIGSFASGINMNDGLMLASCAAMGGQNWLSEEISCKVP